MQAMQSTLKKKKLPPFFANNSVFRSTKCDKGEVLGNK